MEKLPVAPKFDDCGDYSTTVINRNNLSLIDLKMRSTHNTRIADNYMITNTLDATTERRRHGPHGPLLFRVSNKNHGKAEAIPVVLIFFLFQQATILVAATLFEFRKGTRFPVWKASLFTKFINFLLDPAWSWFSREGAAGERVGI